MKPPLSVCIFLLIALSSAGCGPPYPEGTVDEVVTQLCKQEYGIDVKVELSGATLGVYLPIVNILDEEYRLAPEASDKINDVILSLSRATLNAEALNPAEKTNFYIVIVQDPTLPEVEVVIIQCVNDIKMFRFSQIPRSEFFQRAVWELKPTPQAQKEKILKSILSQLDVRESNELLDEFMAKDISVIGDIGYWNNRFFIKDISLNEFLAYQMAERIKRHFRDDPEFKEKFFLNLIKANFIDSPEGKKFELDLEIAPMGKTALFISNEDMERIFSVALDTAGKVVEGYKFEEFDLVSVAENTSGESALATRRELEDFGKGAINIGDLIWTPPLF